jgi:CBS-domain-containing membrane protein
MNDKQAPPLAHSPDVMERLGQRLVRWRLLDSKFRQNKRRYLAQTCGVAVTMLVVLLALDSVSQTVLIASLGASAFIAFAVPRSYASRPRALLGGYLVGTAVGCALSLLSIWLAPRVGAEVHTLQIVGGALAVGLCFLIMVVMNTEHPPAAALALGYVLNDWNIVTVLVVLSGILALSLVKEAFRSKLMDLM